jgi:hypothetical protein
LAKGNQHAGIFCVDRPQPLANGGIGLGEFHNQAREFHCQLAALFRCVRDQGVSWYELYGLSGFAWLCGVARLHALNDIL